MSRFHCGCEHCDRVYGFDRDPAGKYLKCSGCRKYTKVPGSQNFFTKLGDFVASISASTTDRCAWCGSPNERYAPVCRSCTRQQPPPGELYDNPPGK